MLFHFGSLVIRRFRAHRCVCEVFSLVCKTYGHALTKMGLPRWSAPKSGFMLYIYMRVYVCGQFRGGVCESQRLIGAGQCNFFKRKKNEEKNQ